MEESAASEEIYRGKVVTLRVETVPEPIGGTRRFEVVEHAEAVAIVAVRADRKSGGEPEVALVRQTRPAVGRDLWEIPAGLLDTRDSGAPERAASRELAEETGYRASVWRLLARELTSPGFTTERISIFLASDVHPAPGATAGKPADTTEIEEVRWVPLGEALAMCRSGEIEDGKTIAGLYLAHEALAASGATGGAAMPRDTLNMPMAREAAFRAEEAGGRGGEPQHDAGLRLDSMLLEEFNYAGVTAYQCMEDRARMFNLYLLLVGILTSGLAAVYQLGDKVATYSQPLALGLLLTTGVMGIAFFMKLIRLRQANRECLIAMNVIKEYYIKHFSWRLPDVRDAFRWRLLTVPAGERFGSVTFVVCNTVALLASLCFAAAAIVAAELGIGNTHGDLLALPSDALPYALAAAVFLISMLGFTLYFRSSLSKKDEQLLIKRQAEKLGIPLPEYLQHLKG